MSEANTLEEFVVKIGLDPSDYKKESAEFQRRLDRDRQEAARGGKQLEESGKRQREAFRAVKGEILGMLGTLVGASGLRAFVETTVKGDAALGRMSRTLGVNARELAAWQGVLKGAGGSAQDAANDLQILVGASQDLKLTGQSALIPLMQLIGLTAKDLENPTEALLKISDRLSKMDPVQAANLAQRFGFSPAMVTTLVRGRDATAALLAEQRQLSNVTAENVRQAEELQRRWGRLSTSATSLGRSILIDLIPPLQATVDFFTRLTQGRAFPDRLNGITGVGVPSRFLGPQGAANLARERGTAPGARAATAPMSPEARGRFNQAVAFYRGKGWSQQAAEGIAAGMWAESRLDPNAFNAAGGGKGAFGIGQWRGARLDRLRKMYGANPTFLQQLEYMQWELNNDPTERRGGKALFDARTSQEALEVYIRQVMRPAPGREISGDLSRGGRALAQWGGPQTVNVNVGGVTVNTAATDARGMAAGAAGALRPAVAQAVQGLQ